MLPEGEWEQMAAKEDTGSGQDQGRGEKGQIGNM